MFEMFRSRVAPVTALLAVLLMLIPAAAALSAAQPAQQETAQAAPRHAGGEANLVLPDLGQVDFHGINGRTLLKSGLIVCILGLAFGMVIFNQLRNLPVHQSMREISE